MTHCIQRQLYICRPYHRSSYVYRIPHNMSEHATTMKNERQTHAHESFLYKLTTEPQHIKSIRTTISADNISLHRFETKTTTKNMILPTLHIDEIYIYAITKRSQRKIGGKKIKTIQNTTSKTK